jgi:hypothetical protein
LDSDSYRKDFKVARYPSCSDFVKKEGNFLVTNAGWHTVEIKESRTHSKMKKRPYLPPEARKLTREQAEELVKNRTNCGDSEAKDIVESLLRERDERDRKSS